MSKKICIVTGSRAEYGIMKPLFLQFSNEKEVDLQVVVTGMHLSPEFGFTYQEIEEDGFPITEKIEILLSSNTVIGVSKSIGLACISFSEAFERLKPDLILLLGDRYEIFAAATVALLANIPIAHLHGGELTEGAVDDAFRHAITKMSTLHFTSTESYRNRVIQLGEQPSQVLSFGALGVENVKQVSLLTKQELEASLKFPIESPFAVITFHPVTLEQHSAKEQVSSLLEALDRFPKMTLLFTKANSDAEGQIINQMIEEYVKTRKNAIVFASLGQQKYFSTLQFADVVIGNSSSGIIEAPSFHIPTVNIGNRQKGRIYAESVIHCSSDKEAIYKALLQAMDSTMKEKCIHIKNPYEGTDTSKKIVQCILNYLNQNNGEKKKEFYTIPWTEQ